MSTAIAHPATPPGSTSNLYNGIMVVLTLVFIALDGVALTLKSRADERMVVRLEPPIFVIIGYLLPPPRKENERALRQEINSPSATASQSAKEQALRLNGKKIENVKATEYGSPRPGCHGRQHSLGSHCKA